MRIGVRRTGGFAGIERYAEVDTSGRPDAGEWHALAEEAVADGRGTPPIGVPDGFSYQITIDGETVYCADPRLTEAQSRLISQVLKEGA
ncbi:protealysin inhibitor emfourin [Streptomyces sp. NPDC002994]|uniref:protealysin inhibitor emfourin n=1 Tax=Streptomyces sp. NPDC002994 TaxID=3154441 RepID=UPI0033ACE1DC